jgi:outer membrane protein OmpA-like peptidoglycan-associated protein/tetratricopeptide (TPR) repeat protein
MKKSIVLSLLILLFSSQFLSAQSGRLKVGNRHFEQASYIEAIRTYETFLATKSPKKEDHRTALTNLAFSYRKVDDARNAERVYRELIKTYGEEVESEQYLYYAQALAKNEHYRESQKMYSKYGQQQREDLRGRRFTVAYMDESVFYKDSSLYRINYMYPLNSRQSDFSPMYHEGGLVFVSARDEGGIIKRVFMQNETPFLDLFQFPDTTLLVPKEKELQSRTASLSSYGESDNAQEIEAFEKEAKDLSKTEEFSRTLNTKYHEGPVSFFSDHQKLIFTRNSYDKGRSHKSKDGLIMLKLYESTFDGKKWGDVKPLPFNSDDYSCGHPAITTDDSRMYFVSDMRGGHGGTDIYMVDYIDGEWGAPMNLGKEINTEGNEMFPYVDANNDLYFASDGHAGLGGLDIFFVNLENGIPTEEPQNLGHPINSSRDDFGLITDANHGSGFFSSNRRRGYSDDNIYHFTRKCRELRVLVYDAKTKEPIVNADVRLVRNGVNQNLLISDETGAVQICMETMTNFEFQATKSGYQKNSVSYGTMSTSQRNKTEIKIYLEQTKRPIISGTVVSEMNGKPLSGAAVILRNERDGSEEELTTGEDGRYVFQPEKDGRYSVNVLKERYATSSEYLGKVKKNRDESTYQRNIGMIGEGDIFKIDNIYYDLDKYDIRLDAAQELSNKLLPILQKYSDIKIEIRSHTDSRATDMYNLRLSQQRASAVVDYLIRNGVDRSRLIAKGYGENEVVNECLNGVSCSEYKHQENRRTEFKVLTVGNYIGKN